MHFISLLFLGNTSLIPALIPSEEIIIYREAFFERLFTFPLMQFSFQTDYFKWELLI